jgi:cytochrome c-type biogenesis protein CcmE
VKISGKVLGSSILYDQDTHRLTFVITSEDKSKNLNTSYPKDTLKVYYQGIKPDLLNNDVLVIAVDI